MPLTDKEQRRAYNQLYYLKKKPQQPATQAVYTAVYDDTVKRIHNARFRKTLKTIKNGDALYGFFEDLWIQKYKDVILEYADKIDDYTDYKRDVIDRKRARCDRCEEIFTKRPETNQYTCNFCMNKSLTRGICYITLDE